MNWFILLEDKRGYGQLAQESGSEWSQFLWTIGGGVADATGGCINSAKKALSWRTTELNSWASLFPVSGISKERKGAAQLVSAFPVVGGDSFQQSHVSSDFFLYTPAARQQVLPKQQENI